MAATIESDATLRHPHEFFIGGRWVKPSTGAQFEVRDGASEQVQFTVAAAEREDMAVAIGAAREAFDAGPWPRLSHEERAAYMRMIANAIRERADELGSIWSHEMGILRSLSTPGTIGTAGFFDMYADFASTFPFIESHTPTAGGKAGYLVREPVGVVGAIIPWNGPLALITYKLAPAMLTGCTTVVKASPEAPGEAYILAEIAEQIGLPAGVINVVTADREVSETLVTDPRVDKIAFTGSTAAGRRIASLCGDRIARYTLELGGKSAALILDDFDVEVAANTIAASTCVMTGQVCASLTRVVVGPSQHDSLVEALREAFAAVRVGDPFDANTTMGPLVSERQLRRVEGYVERGVSEGGLLVTGGQRPADLEHGYFIGPTVFAQVENSATIAQEEIFGPVLSVIAARDEDDAVAIANDSVFGLNASVFTNDADRAFAVARRLRSGTVGHNAQRTDFGIAFGGFKQSGVGREGGREGIGPYLETKTIILEDIPATTPGGLLPQA